jgi:integron integrase
MGDVKMAGKRYYESPFIRNVVIPKIRVRQLGYRTEETYVNWIGQFIVYHKVKAPEALREGAQRKVEQFLTYLAAEREVSASTQNVAFSALLFLYRHVLRVELAGVHALRVPERKRVPVVVDRETVLRLVAALPDETLRLMAGLLYGSGLRLRECVRLRVKDVDTRRFQVTVRDGKGDKDRVTILPKRLAGALERQIAFVRQLHRADLVRGHGAAYVPPALARKYTGAAREPGWQWLFPSKSISEDHHVSESSLQKALKGAVRRLGVDQRVSCHTLRHCFATHLLEDLTARGENAMAALEQVREYLGHADIRTTMVYLHLTRKAEARSPLDAG